MYTTDTFGCDFATHCQGPKDQIFFLACEPECLIYFICKNTMKIEQYIPFSLVPGYGHHRYEGRNRTDTKEFYQSSLVLASCTRQFSHRYHLPPLRLTNSLRATSNSQSPILLFAWRLPRVHHPPIVSFSHVLSICMLEIRASETSVSYDTLYLADPYST